MAITVGGYVCMKKSEATKLKKAASGKVSGTRKRKSTKRKSAKKRR